MINLSSTTRCHRTIRHTATFANAISVSLLLAGCQSPTPLRAEYDRIRLHKPLPSNFAIPPCARVNDTPNVYTVNYHPPNQTIEFQDNFGLAAQRDPDGAVIAKHFWSFDETVVPFLWASEVSSLRWEFDPAMLAVVTTMPSDAPPEMDAIEEICRRNCEKWWTLKQAMKALRAESASSKRPFNLTAMRHESRIGLEQRATYRLWETSDAIHLSCDEQAEVSLTVYTLLGWGAFLRTGKID